jgi:hypothetical protein
LEDAIKQWIHNSSDLKNRIAEQEALLEEWKKVEQELFPTIAKALK